MCVEYFIYLAICSAIGSICYAVCHCVTRLTHLRFLTLVQHRKSVRWDGCGRSGEISDGPQPIILFLIQVQAPANLPPPEVRQTDTSTVEGTSPPGAEQERQENQTQHPTDLPPSEQPQKNGKKPHQPRRKQTQS